MIKKIVSSDRKIRVAIVGCGRISKKQFESIDDRSDELDLVSICDSDANILDLYRKKYGVPAYLHLNEMIENAIRRHNRRSTIISAILVWILIGGYSFGLFHVVQNI